MITIFIHGAGSSSAFWHEQREVFPEAHYITLPGHAREVAGPGSKVSGQFRGTWDVGAGTRDSLVEEYADCVASYIESERLESVVLNGHSMGGAIALTLALRKAAWLRGMVLTGTGARLRVVPRLLELLRTDYPAAVEHIVEQSFAQPSTPLTYAQRIRINGARRLLLRTPQAVTLADYEACDRFDAMARLGELDLPTLCIVGAKDLMTPPKYSEYLHKQIRGSQLEIVEGAGHMLPVEKPDEYNRRVAEFLRLLSHGG
jgi:pimeloyl-ACP methyl ester carboxylesterase